MTIQNFISQSFEKINKHFNQATIEYQFDVELSVHYIKVTPPSVYDNEKFSDLGWKLKDTFYTYFPMEDLCFLTDDSLIVLNNPSRTYDPQLGGELIFDKGELVGLVTTVIPSKEYSWGKSNFVVSQEGEDEFVTSEKFEKLFALENYQYAMAA